MRIEKCSRPTKHWNWIEFIFAKRIRFTAYFCWGRWLHFEIDISFRGIFIGFTPFSFHFDWYHKTTEEFLRDE